MPPKPKTRLAAPTVEYLLALKAEVQRNFADDDKLIDDARKTRALTRETILDDKYRLTDIDVRDPTLTDEVQRVVATLSLNPPKLRVTPANAEADSAQQNATLREHWTEEVLKIAGSRGGQGRNTFRDIVDGVCGDGGAWSKLLFMPDTWDVRYSIDQDTPFAEYDRLSEEAKKDAGPPFAWVYCDPRDTYPVWSKGQLTEVLEIKRMPVNTSLRQFRVGVSQDGRFCSEELGVPLNRVDGQRVPDNVVFLEHVDQDWITYYIELEQGSTDKTRSTLDSKILRQWAHGYGQCPYFYTPGHQMAFQRGRKVGWGVSESKRWMIEYRSYLMTLSAQVATVHALPPVFRERPDTSTALNGDDAQPTDTEFWEPREIINGKPGEKMYPVDFGSVGIGVKEELANITSMIEKSLSPRISSEIGSGDPGSGFAINQIITEAKIRENPLAQNIEQTMDDVTRLLWKLARDKVRETIWVAQNDKDASGWLKVDPEKDLTPGVGIHWIVDPERPSGLLMLERLWGERLQQGTASLDMAINDMGDNPDEVRVGRMLDSIRASQQYQDWLRREVFQQAGRGDLIAEAAKAMQAATDGELPGGPPGANGPIQGAMGSQGIPDMGALALTPGGGGANAPEPVGAGSLGAAGPTPSAQPMAATSMGQ